MKLIFKSDVCVNDVSNKLEKKTKLEARLLTNKRIQKTLARIESSTQSIHKLVHRHLPAFIISLPPYKQVFSPHGSKSKTNGLNWKISSRLRTCERPYRTTQTSSRPSIATSGCSCAPLRRTPMYCSAVQGNVSLFRVNMLMDGN